MDIENLDELISMCEDKMVSPFKKKAPKIEEKEVEEPEEMEETEEKSDISDMDKDALLEMYQNIKGE